MEKYINHFLNLINDLISDKQYYLLWTICKELNLSLEENHELNNLKSETENLINTLEIEDRDRVLKDIFQNGFFEENEYDDIELDEERWFRRYLNSLSQHQRMYVVSQICFDVGIEGNFLTDHSKKLLNEILELNNDLKREFMEEIIINSQIDRLDEEDIIEMIGNKWL